MQIKQSLITKLVLSELDKLDPITVFIEGIDSQRGNITIECANKSWSTSFSSCGNQGLTKLITSQHPEYLIGRFAPHIEKYEFDFDQYREEMREKIIEMRKDECVSKDLARELFDIRDWSQYVTSNPYEPIRNPCIINDDEFEELDFQGFDVPERITFEYDYLCRVIEAVQDGLRQVTIDKAA